jgi:hypothetical protein
VKSSAVVMQETTHSSAADVLCAESSTADVLCAESSTADVLCAEAAAETLGGQQPLSNQEESDLHLERLRLLGAREITKRALGWHDDPAVMSPFEEDAEVCSESSAVQSCSVSQPTVQAKSNALSSLSKRSIPKLSKLR